MSQLHNVIQSLSNISNSSELEHFLSELKLQPIYTYSALVFGFPNTKVIGELPSYLDSVLTEGEFERYINKLTKPVWKISDRCSDDNFFNFQINNCLLIPSLKGAKKSGVVLLGITPEPHVVRAVEQLTWYWQLVSVYLFDALYRCLPEESETPLTSRELECLQWVAEGKTSWEVSQILGVSERTVNFHISNVMQKTNSSTRQQAVSKFISTY